MLFCEENQLYVYIYTVPLGPLFLAPQPFHPSHSTPHRNQAELRAIQQVPGSYFTRGSLYMLMLCSQFIPASPFPAFVRRAALYLSMSIPALQIGSSVQFT